MTPIARLFAVTIDCPNPGETLVTDLLALVAAAAPAYTPSNKPLSEATASPLAVPRPNTLIP